MIKDGNIRDQEKHQRRWEDQSVVINNKIYISQLSTEVENPRPTITLIPFTKQPKVASNCIYKSFQQLQTATYHKCQLSELDLIHNFSDTVRSSWPGFSMILHSSLCNFHSLLNTSPAMKLMFSQGRTHHFHYRSSPPVQHKGTGANDYAVFKF